MTKTAGITPEQIEQRRIIVADLYLNKWSTRRIAAHMDVHHSTIAEDIKAIRAHWITEQTQSYEERVASELAECDYLRAALSHRVDTGDIQAILAAIRILERRAKYLALDSPTRVVVDPAMTAELRELAEKLNVTDDPEIRELLSAVN
jgi:ABC-type branched-subunit amino acid transport system ATPase component